MSIRTGTAASSPLDQVVLPWVGAGASFSLFPGWLDTLKGLPSASNPWTGHQRLVAGVWKDMGKSDTEFDDLCKKLQCLPEVTDSMGDHAEIIKGAHAGALTHQAQRLARGSIRCRVSTDMLGEIPSGWDNGQG